MLLSASCKQVTSVIPGVMYVFPADRQSVLFVVVIGLRFVWFYPIPYHLRDSRQIYIVSES
ncbi:hypothetical protein D3C81_1086490 [compost metagenome]